MLLLVVGVLNLSYTSSDVQVACNIRSARVVEKDSCTQLSRRPGESSSEMTAATFVLCRYVYHYCIQIEGRQVAIKKIGDVFSDLVDAKRIVREIKLLRHFDGHENIISIVDIMTIPPGTTEFKDVYIVTNLMESDMDRIIASGQPLTDQHFNYFIYQVSFFPQKGQFLAAAFFVYMAAFGRFGRFRKNFEMFSFGLAPAPDFEIRVQISVLGIVPDRYVKFDTSNPH